MPIRTAKIVPIIAKTAITIINTFFFDAHLICSGAKGILLSIAIYHNVTKTAIFAIAITVIIISIFFVIILSSCCSCIL
jgi:hypothetical protein